MLVTVPYEGERVTGKMHIDRQDFDNLKQFAKGHKDVRNFRYEVYVHNPRVSTVVWSRLKDIEPLITVRKIKMPLMTVCRLNVVN